MTVNQRSNGSPARGSSPPSSCQGGGLRRCSSDDFILIRLNLMEFKEMRSGAVSVQWLDFLKRRHRDLWLVSKSGLCIFLMHTMDKKSKPQLVGFRRHMLCCHVKVMVGTGQGNAVGVPCWFFLHVIEPSFFNAGETAEDMQTLTSGAAAAFSAGLLRRRRHAQPAAACLPRGMLSGSRDV